MNKILLWLFNKNYVWSQQCFKTALHIQKCVYAEVKGQRSFLTIAEAGKKIPSFF